MKKYIAYYRVSTKKQGKSGLGLEAQKIAVQNHTNSCDNCVLNEHIEIESGKNNSRPKLMAAIKEAKEKNATLLVAKLDRLSRNASFVLALRDSKVDFICCDMPEANNLTIGLMAIIAQEEREKTAKRTKEALAAKRAKEGEWRVSNLDNDARRKAIATNINKAANNQNNKRAISMIKMMLDSNLQPLQPLKEIARTLNQNEFKTSRGKEFKPMTVKRLIDRLKKQEA